jgi:peptidoglycan biosynthesis protein MviN/MurJ (putative lipid II flippase)
MVINSVGATLTILLSFALTWLWNIEGMLFSFIIAGLIQNLLGLSIIRNRFEIGPNLNHSSRIFLGSIFAGVVTLGIQWIIPNNLFVFELVLGAVIFVTLFLILAPIIGVIEINDIITLDSIFRSIKVFYPIARLILKFEKKLLKYRILA